MQALENLQNSLSYDVNVKDQGNEIAYALYVLARNRKAAISDLRYYADTKLAEFPTPLGAGASGRRLVALWRCAALAEHFHRCPADSRHW